jgi:uncharacterized protein
VLTDAPRFGVGVTWFSGLGPLLRDHADLVDVVEVEPETLWLPTPDGYRADEGAQRELVEIPLPKLFHGIGFPVGGSRPPDPGHLPLLLRMLGDLEPRWMSEHLSFNEALGPGGTYKTGFLLPPRQSPQGAAAAVRSIRSVAERVPVPFLVETGVNYLRSRPDELDDGAFIASVIEEADCGLLLDLHNLWTNELNGRQTVEAFLAQIPLERVWEMHLAGGSERAGYWLDSHSGPSPGELMDLAAEVVPRFPSLRAIVFEIFPGYYGSVGEGPVREQLLAMRALWERAGRSRSMPATDRTHRIERRTDDDGDEGPSPSEWEDALGGLVVGRAGEGPLERELASDPGVAIVAGLLAEFRTLMVLTCLKLTSRLIILSAGQDAFEVLLRDHWRQTPPEPFTATEALNFASFLSGAEASARIEHLRDVLAFERAVLETLLDGSDRVVPFAHDPLRVLRPLAEGSVPSDAKEGRFEVEVTGGDVDHLAGSASNGIDVLGLQQVAH